MTSRKISLIFSAVRASRWTVDRHDAAEDGDRITFKGAGISGKKVIADRDPTGVGMFDGHRGRFVEFENQLPGGIEIIQIVKG